MANRRRAIGQGLAGAAVLGLPGCTLLGGPIRVPMDVLRDDNGCPDTLAPDALVLLPGANMAPSELVREGFVQAVRQRGLAVDMLLPDAHLGYAYDGSMLQHLHDDVVAPALAQGRRRVWLAGISLGGYGALGYAQQHPGQIAGVFAIAPYLGRQSLLQAILAAGGPAAWRQAARQPAATGVQDIDSALWQWLADPHRPGPPLWLGYGREDRLSLGHGLLAGLLPAANVDVVPGGHDWPPWQQLWAQWLDRGLLPPRPGGGCTA